MLLLQRTTSPTTSCWLVQQAISLLHDSEAFEGFFAGDDNLIHQGEDPHGFTNGLG